MTTARPATGIAASIPMLLQGGIDTLVYPEAYSQPMKLR